MAESLSLDARLQAAATLALEAMRGRQHPRAADIGCDHGQLTAYLLEQVPDLTMLSSDVSAPSLQKARKLLAGRGLSGRAQLAVADGLAALADQEPVQAVIIAGMGAGTILKIVESGLACIGDAALIVQANVDLPLLRCGLSRMGFAIEREIYCEAAGRHYVTLQARRGEPIALDERSALLGAARGGVQGEGQRQYFLWQRGVRMRELQQLARHGSDRGRARMERCSRELMWISEVLGMNACTVSEMERIVGTIAPYELAEEWDNVGLLFGRSEAEVTRVLVALDLTQAVLDEAKALGAQLIVTHHPILFHARKRVTDRDREGRLMLDMARADVALIAAHTNLDSAPGGVNDVLMEAMGCTQVSGEGAVRVGRFETEMTLGRLCERARQRLHAQVRAYGAEDTPVHVLGCCSGAGGSELSRAVLMGADCFITGEIHHHEALDALDAGCTVIEAGHFETENPVCEVLRGALQKAVDALQYNVTVFCSEGHPFGRG